MTSKKRKIGVYTGNRAEYGLLCPILRAIEAHPELQLFLFVSGAHLEDDFGGTLQEIRDDGFEVYCEVKLQMEGDNLRTTAEAIGSGILGLAPKLESLMPDIFVVYADRFEGFSSLITSTQMGIPTAHIEGGDITEGGALDDMVRHAMTKLAHLHFTTNEAASERIRKMGEEPWRIVTAGFPTIDLIRSAEYASPNEIIEKYRLDPEKPVVVFSQHSVSTEFTEAASQILPSLRALSRLGGEGVQVIMTYPNNDAGTKSIIAELDRLQSCANVQVHKSLGRYNYHGVMNFCRVFGRGVYAGNSSSGIKETPAFGIPAIDIGDRQKGRLRANNVLHVSYDEDAIYQAIKTGLENQECRRIAATCENPYGSGNSSKIIADRLAEVELNKRLVQKKMTY